MVLTPAPEMTGTLPSTMGGMSSLNYLAIASTSIQGSIPTEIGMLSNLQNLIVEANLLTGTVPNQVVTMPSLSKFLPLGTCTRRSPQENLFSRLIVQLFSHKRNTANLQINFNEMTGTISQALCDKHPSLVIWLDCSKMVCENDCCPSGWCTGT